MAKDLKDGRKAGVSGTPAFFINGVYLRGAAPAASFSRLVDDELGRAMESRLPIRGPRGFARLGSPN